MGPSPEEGLGVQNRGDLQTEVRSLLSEVQILLQVDRSHLWVVRNLPSSCPVLVP